MGARSARLVAGLAAALAACGASDAGPVYDVWADSASVGLRDPSGTCWEATCSAPRTYACASVGRATGCSTPQTGTTPSWFEVIVPRATAAALRGGCRVDIRLGGGAAGDRALCENTFVIGAAVLSAGHFDLTCGDLSVSYGVRASP